MFVTRRFWSSVKMKYAYMQHYVLQAVGKCLQSYIAVQSILNVARIQAKRSALSISTLFDEPRRRASRLEPRGLLTVDPG